MRILLVNKFHWNKGGSETYYFELGKILKKHGHEIAYFSMNNNNNICTMEKEYFVNELNSNGKNILKAVDVVYSKENKLKMKYALEEFKPDIVHINLFQRHLTYSIIEVIKQKNIPIVFTAHDMQAICPASAMLCNGKICEKCLTGSKFNCFKNRCIKESYVKSLLASIESEIYMKKKVYNMMNIIITPSKFIENKLRESGIKSKIITMHNFVDTEKFNNKCNIDKGYAFFFGRLSIEKGILNLLNTFSMQEMGKLYIAGEGPEKENIIKYIKDNKLEDRIKMLGFLKQNEIKKYISESSFVVVPSICYENCPYSILETLASGKPIIGAKIGGIPELIEESKNGYLYEYNDLKKLSKLMNTLFKNKNIREEYGKYSRLLAEKKYNIEKYYDELIKIYKNLVEVKNYDN